MARYHVTLNGKGYLLDPRSYRKRALRRFVGKVGAGDPDYGDVAFGAVWAQRDWRGGLGRLVWDAARPDGYADGYNLEVTDAGRLRLGPALLPIVSDGGPRIWRMHPYGEDLYAVSDGEGKLYRWNGSTWSTAWDTGASGLLAMAVYKGSLYLGGNGGTVYRWNGSSGGVAFTIGDAVRVPVMGVYAPDQGQWLYLGYEAADGTQLAQTENGSAYVGQGPRLGYAAVEDLVVYRGQVHLLVTHGRRSAIFTHAIDGNGYALAHEGERFVRSAVWGDHLYLSTVDGGRIYRWDGNSLELATVVARDYPQALRGLVAHDGALWVAVADATKGLHLRAWDGQRWHMGPAGGNGTGDGPGLVAYRGRLYVANRGGTGRAVYRVGPALSTSGQYTSAVFEGELPGETKAFRRFRVVHTALGPGEAVGLEFRVDGGVWDAVVGAASDGTGATVGTFPTSTVGKRMEVRVTVQGPGGTTPEVLAVEVEYVVQPARRREWELALLCEGSDAIPQVLLDQDVNPRSGETMAQELWDTWALDRPVSFTDLDGEQYTVWVADVREEVAAVSQRTGRQTRVLVTLVEA